MCIYIHTYIHTYKCIYTYICIHSYIITYIHTYIHAYIHIFIYRPFCKNEGDRNARACGAVRYAFFNLFFQYCFIFVTGPFARMKLAEMPEPAGLWDMLSKYVSSVGGTGLAVCVSV